MSCVSQTSLPPLPRFEAGEGKGARAGESCSREGPLTPCPSPPLGGEGEAQGGRA